MNTNGAEIVTTYALNGGASQQVQGQIQSLQTTQSDQQTEIEVLQALVGVGSNVLDGGTF